MSPYSDLLAAERAYDKACADHAATLMATDRARSKAEQARSVWQAARDAYDSTRCE